VLKPLFEKAPIPFRNGTKKPSLRPNGKKKEGLLNHGQEIRRTAPT